MRKCVTCAAEPPEGKAFCEGCWAFYETVGNRKTGCIRCGGGKGGNRVLCSACAGVVRAIARGEFEYMGNDKAWGVSPPKVEKDPRPKPKAAFPHSCPRCGGPAYVGFSRIECKSESCR